MECDHRTEGVWSALMPVIRCGREQRQVFAELGAKDKPVPYVFSKTDAIPCAELLLALRRGLGARVWYATRLLRLALSGLFLDGHSSSYLNF